jgi:hypothetical protein
VIIRRGTLLWSYYQRLQAIVSVWIPSRQVLTCAEDLRAELFVNATREAIPKLLNSDVHQEKGTVVKLFLLGAKYGAPVDLRPWKHAHKPTEDLRAGLFDDATKASIPKLLNSDIYRARETAIELLSLAANHGKLDEYTLWCILTGVQMNSKRPCLTIQ